MSNDDPLRVPDQPAPEDQSEAHQMALRCLYLFEWALAGQDTQRLCPALKPVIQALPAARSETEDWLTRLAARKEAALTAARKARAHDRAIVRREEAERERLEAEAAREEAEAKAAEEAAKIAAEKAAKEKAEAKAARAAAKAAAEDTKE